MKTSTFIKKMRVQLRYSQEELAKLLGVRQMTVSSWEVGRCKPTASTAMKIIKFCAKNNIHVTLEDLLIN